MRVGSEAVDVHIQLHLSALGQVGNSQLHVGNVAQRRVGPHKVVQLANVGAVVVGSIHVYAQGHAARGPVGNLVAVVDDVALVRQQYALLVAQGKWQGLPKAQRRNIDGDEVHGARAYQFNGALSPASICP